MLYNLNLKTPITAVWEITEECNFKCPHCRAAYASKSDDINIENSIMNELIKNHILSVNISGGEPLLNRRINKIVEKLVSNGIDTGISSNGWYFKEKGKELIEKGLSFIQVSIDGTPDVHDKFRGVNGAYNRAIEALQFAKENEIRTQMNVTITSENIDSLDYNIKVAKELGIDRIFFRRVLPTGRGETNRYVLPKKEKYIETIKHLSSINIDGLDIAIDDPIIGVLKNQSINIIGCTAGIKSVGIASDGSVYPCIFFRECIGNLNTTSLKEIWDSSDVLKKMRSRDIGECGLCKYKYSCGGCRAYSGFEKIDEMCPIQ